MTQLSQIPDTRFDTTPIHAYLDSPSIVPITGNLLSSPAAFDNKFFNISPRAAGAMDPQQWILLHVAYEALDNAGCIPDSPHGWKEEDFVCYIGAATGGWADCLREQADLYHSAGTHMSLRFCKGPTSDALGTLQAFLSGRISHFMKWEDHPLPPTQPVDLLR